VMLFRRSEERKARRNSILMQCVRSEGDRIQHVLHEMLPPDFYREMTTSSPMSQSHVIRSYPSVTVLYSDLKGFTAYASSKQPIEVLAMLRSLFRRFDQLLSRHGLFKIDTIGDAYVCMSTTSAADLANMAVDMMKALGEFNSENQSDLGMRIGLATGPLYAGIVGTQQYRYHAWGDVVNRANTLQEEAGVGNISIDTDTFRLVRDVFECELVGPWVQRACSSLVDDQSSPLMTRRSLSEPVSPSMLGIDGPVPGREGVTILGRSSEVELRPGDRILVSLRTDH